MTGWCRLDDALLSDMRRELADEFRVRSVGFLLLDERDFIVLVLNLGFDEVADGMAIPRSAIRAVHVL